MKRMYLFAFLFVFILLEGCNNYEAASNTQPITSENSDILNDEHTDNTHDSELIAEDLESPEGKNELTKVNITIGTDVFTAVFYNNTAAQNLIAQMPLSLNMSDINQNEKYYYLPEDLPSTATERPSSITSGEIMCWSGNCLVLFYDTFSNSYDGYVRLGYIEDTSGLVDALGTGDITIIFNVS